MSHRAPWWQAAVLLAVLAWNGGVPAAAATEPPPVADFYRVPKLHRPLMSPDNRHVAVAIAGPGGYRRLAVFDVDKPDSAQVVASFNDADVDRYQWVSSKRLVLSVGDDENPDRALAPGLWAVDSDGGDFRQLVLAGFFSETKVADRRLPARWRLHSVLRDGSDDVLVEAPTFDGAFELTGMNLARLDTRTGLSRSLSLGAPEHAVSWVVDRSGAPVALTTFKNGRRTTMLKEAQGWTAWEEGDAFGADLVQPYWIGPAGELLVRARRGRDTLALFQADRKTLQLPAQPLVSTPGYDFTGEPVFDSAAGRVLGWRYETDAPGTVWLDPAMKTLQA
ncbi:hypothetical protein [Pelomonas sp. KK5]|uniref:hypothetical protein n=1 Tax=Pelomonas sp. KK5 TaxID=1855730 RepID=UPI0009FAE6DE|nr:hypothetical protein [Pelomonas sp. KK5]